MPEAIVVIAASDDPGLAGTRCEVNGHTVIRWGIDSTARLVLRELPDPMIEA